MPLPELCHAVARASIQTLVAALRFVAFAWAVGSFTSACKLSRPVEQPSEEGGHKPSHDLVMLAGGSGHVCALRTSGEVLCWGRNDSGQLGDGSRAARTKPVRVVGLGDALEIVAGEAHTCARRTGGTVACWGSNDRGQLGAGKLGGVQASPVGVPGIRGASYIIAGGRQTCVDVAGRVSCWGDNRRGQLGGRSRASVVTPQPLAAAGGGSRLALGRAHACVRRNDGSVLCWGANDAGQLGDGGTQSRDRPARVRNLGAVDQVSAFEDRTCAAVGRTVFCWGRTATDDAQLVPARRDLPSNVASLALGRTHTCAIGTGGEVMCWGDNEQGQLGAGHRRPDAAVATPSGLTKARSLAAAGDSTCVLQGKSEVRCWGSDAHGALGNGVAAGTLPHEPAAVAGIDDAVSVASGEAFACAVRRNGQVECWGEDGRGQLGDGPSTADKRTPNAVPGLRDMVAVAAGTAHTCAASRRGDVWCWGDNRAGQASSDADKRIDTPRKVSGVRGIKHLAAGEQHTCAAAADGSVTCWGEVGGTTRRGPTKVAGLSGVVELSAGYRHTCARASTGRALCWGENLRGQIGHGAGAASLDEPVWQPRAVSRLDDAVALASGAAFSCAARRDGRVSCWGDNGLQQLGSGTASNVWTTPVPVRQLAGMQGVTAGRDHACAFGSGKVYCWGIGDAGQLGLPATSSVGVPAHPVALDVVELAAGQRHTCARLRSGSVMCWGDDTHGQIGGGARGPALRPEPVRGL